MTAKDVETFSTTPSTRMQRTKSTHCTCSQRLRQNSLGSITQLASLMHFLAQHIQGHVTTQCHVPPSTCDRRPKTHYVDMMSSNVLSCHVWPLLKLELVHVLSIKCGVTIHRICLLRGMPVMVSDATRNPSPIGHCWRRVLSRIWQKVSPCV